MRKIVGAVSAVVLVSAAIVTGSKTLLVTQAVGMGVEGVGAQNAAVQIADRFPTDTEVFRQAAALAACASLFSPAPTTDCLAVGGKPVPPTSPARPAPVVERQAATIASEPRTTTVSAERVAVAIPVAAAAPVRAPAAVAPASCAQNLAAANARVERVLARIKEAHRGADACAAYRSDFFAVVQAREVTALCKSGPERDRDLGRIDGAVEDINGAIAQSCGT